MRCPLDGSQWKKLWLRLPGQNAALSRQAGNKWSIV
jgi:hypothetical protein